MITCSEFLFCFWLLLKQYLFTPLINCSAIEGYETAVLVPQDPTSPSAITEIDKVKRHIIFTAETHNFPTGINKLLKELKNTNESVLSLCDFQYC